MGGYPKPLIKFKGKYFVEYIYENLISINAEKILFVAGHKSELVIKRLGFLDKIIFLINKDYKSGQFSSLKCGLEYIQNNKIDFDNIMISLSDTPFVKIDTYKKIIESIEKDKIIIPSYNFSAGHPVIIDKFLFDIMLNSPLTSVSKNIINSFKSKIKYVNVGDENIINDFDCRKLISGDDWEFEL